MHEVALNFDRALMDESHCIHFAPLTRTAEESEQLHIPN